MSWKDYSSPSYIVIDRDRKPNSGPGCLPLVILALLCVGAIELIKQYWLPMLVFVPVIALVIASYYNRSNALNSHHDFSSERRLETTPISGKSKRKVLKQALRADEIRRQIKADQALRQLSWPREREELISAWALYEADGDLPAPADSTRAAHPARRIERKTTPATDKAARIRSVISASIELSWMHWPDKDVELIRAWQRYIDTGELPVRPTDR